LEEDEHDAGNQHDTGDDEVIGTDDGAGGGDTKGKAKDGSYGNSHNEPADTIMRHLASATLATILQIAIRTCKSFFMNFIYCMQPYQCCSRQPLSHSSTSFCLTCLVSHDGNHEHFHMQI